MAPADPPVTTDSDRLSRAAIARATLHDLGDAGVHEVATTWPRLAQDVVDLATTVTDQATPTVALIALDRLGQVERMHGRGGHDGVLAEVTDRLRTSRAPGEVVHRLEGGRFAVLGLAADDAEALDLGERLVRVLGRPAVVGGLTVHLSACVGVARAVDGITDLTRADALLGDAGMALDAAVAQGRGRLVLTDQAMRTAAARRQDLEGELVGALGRGELHLEFQPIVDLRTRQAAGAEALLRWAHPRLGTVPPVEFLPLAEAAGLMDVIGMWVVNEALRTAATWPEGTYVSVNLSAAQLRITGVARMVQVALARAGLDADRLRLELTESILLEDSDTALRELEALRAQGIRVGLDDFGTGYASMSYLKRLTVDFIKVDREFVAGLGRSPVDEAIVGACMALADALGLEVVGEGVEEAGQEQALAALGCRLTQGYGYARPARPEQLTLAGTWPTPDEG